MADKDQKQNHLANVQSGTLLSRSSKISVQSLEKALLLQFPAEDAEDWDRTGLLAGDPMASVTKVAVALDPTVEAIEGAQSAGANVLVTHHPAFLDAPDSFMPGISPAKNKGAVVYAAIKNEVALMNFHTALDVSEEAARVLPGLLSLNFSRIILPISKDGKKGYGQLCEVAESDAGLTLGHLAARCTSVFGRHPRVWGDFSTKLTRVVTCAGSASDIISQALAAHADALVCGEIRYHDALEASDAGLSIVDVGHDTSELPLVATLVTALEKVGLAQGAIIVIDQGSHWGSPETTRL